METNTIVPYYKFSELNDTRYNFIILSNKTKMTKKLYQLRHKLSGHTNTGEEKYDPSDVFFIKQTVKNYYHFKNYFRVVKIFPTTSWTIVSNKDGYENLYDPVRKQVFIAPLWCIS